MRRQHRPHVVRIDAERVRHHVLHLGGVLRRAVHQHAAVLVRNRVRDLAFEIELLLAADRAAALQSVRRAGDRASASPRTMCIGGSTYCCMACASRASSTGGSASMATTSLASARGASRRIARAGDHHEHRLAEVLHRAVGQDRVVVHDRAAVVAAGDVLGTEHVDARPASLARRRGRSTSSGRAPPATGRARRAACRPVRACRRCRSPRRPRAGAPIRAHADPDGRSAHRGRHRMDQGFFARLVHVRSVDARIRLCRSARRPLEGDV